MCEESDQVIGQVCVDACISEYTGLVRAIAHKYCRDNSYIDDCVQEGFLALMRARELFDAPPGMPFRPYAAQRIRSAIARWQDNHLDHVRVPIHQQEAQRRARRELERRMQLTDASGVGHDSPLTTCGVLRSYTFSLDDTASRAESRVPRTRHETIADTARPSAETVLEARERLQLCAQELYVFRQCILQMRDVSRSGRRIGNRYDTLLWYYFGSVKGGPVTLRHIAHTYCITRAAAHQRLANTWRYIRKTHPEYSHRWVVERRERVELLRELVTTS